MRAQPLNQEKRKMQNKKERENKNGLTILLVPLKLKAERILQSLYMLQNFILFYMDVTEKNLYHRYSA